MSRFTCSAVAAVLIGVGASFAFVPAVALMFSMPALSFAQRSRRTAYCVAVAYYASASWAMMPAARNFLGPEPLVLLSVCLWHAASLLLAMPWAAAWTADRDQAVWRILIGLIISTLPPLGIIGWASPLTSAGMLFPGSGWYGVAATALLPGLLVLSPRMALAGAAVGVLASHLFFPGTPAAPKSWQAVNTTFGAIAHGERSPLAVFEAAAQIQEIARMSDARVILFPETVVPIWTEATDLFWQQTLAKLRASGKTIMIGVGQPVAGARPLIYRNALMIAGAETGTFYQRVPVPLGMWRPFSRSGVPLNLTGPGTTMIVGRRAAVLICYEQLLTWPVFLSMAERPSIIIAVANDHWAANTPIPQCQRAVIWAWCRLFALPELSATNL